MGQLTFGAMKDLGDAAINMPVKLLGWEKGLAAIEAENVKLTKSFRYLVAGGVGLAATALSVAAYETIKMIGVNNDLTRQLAQTGGVFGVASANVDAYNFSMVNAGISMRESSEIMTLMAASSNLSISSFDMIKVSAENMSKYAGVAIKDTVAAFDKMAGDPVKALTELAIKTGSVDSETLKLVYTLEKQGNMAQAAAVGMQALADHNSKAAKKMQEDLHPLTLTFIKIGDFYDKWSSLVLPDFDFMSRGGHKQRDVQSEINKIKNIPEWRRTKEDKEKIEHLEEQLRLLNKQQDVDVFRAQENSRNARREKADAALREQTLTKEAKITSDIEKMRKNILFGEVSKDEGEAYIKKLEGDLSDLKKKESKKQVREAERASAYEKTALEQLSDAYNQKALKDLDPVQKKLLDLMNDPKFLQQSVHVREEIESQAAEYSRLLGIQTQATNNNLASEFASEKLSEAYSKTVGNLKNLTEVEREYLNLKDNPKYQKASKETQDRIDQEAERYIKLTKSILLAKDAQEGLKQIREAEQQLEDLRFEDSVSRRSEREQQVERATYALKKQMRLSDYQLQTDLDKALNESDETLMFQQIDRAYRLHELRKKLYGEQFDISTRQMTDMEKRAKSYDNVFQNTFEKIGDAMATSFITGKDTFKDMIDNMLADLLRLEIKMQMMKMYESMGGGSKDGILGALLKLGVSTATGSPTSGATTDVTAFARGGVVNRTTSFGMRGGGMGIAGEAGPEAILPLTRTSNGNLGVAAQASSSNVQIVINNNSAASISQKETVDSRGNRRVELTVSEMVAGEVKRNGSMMQRSMSNTFGSKPTLISR
jgi:phage-related minor tail protein